MPVTSLLMGGGKVKEKFMPDVSGFNVGVLVFLFVILKVLAVQYSYNRVMPILIRNNGGNTNSFKPLTFEEALVLVLFIMFLF